MPPHLHALSSSVALIVKPESTAKMAPHRARIQFESTPEPSSPADHPLELIETPPPDEETKRPSLPSESTPTDGGVGALPASSPGLEYYQRVVGVAHGSQTSQPTTPVGSDSSSSVPKLTKKGYTVTPSLEDLAIMSEADLAAVAGFAVKRSGYGMVEWEGAVDVRGADLDSIVVIEHQSVEVYTQEEERGEKPPVGSKLNRIAQITFYEVFPKNGGVEATEEAKARFAAKVEKSTRKMGAEFLSYNQDTGVWKIRVRHFSRWALDDDETDEEGAVDSATQSRKVQVTFAQEAPGTLPQKRKSLASRQPTPWKPSRIALKDVDMSDSFGDDAAVVSDVEMTTSELEKIEASRAEAEKVDRELLESLDTSLAVRSDSWESPKAAPVAISFADEGLEDAKSDTGRIRHAADDRKWRMASSAQSISGRLARKMKLKSSSVDMGMQMRGSFRVAWSPDGSFLKLGSGGPSPYLVKYRPDCAAGPTFERSAELLESHLSNSVSMSVEGSTCPLYSLPSGQQNLGRLDEALISFAASKGICKDVRHAFHLIASFHRLDCIESGSSLPRKSQMEAVLQFLVQLCESDVAKDIKSATQRNDYYSAIFAALTGGNVEKACDLAVDAGYLHLLTALSVGSEGRKDIIRQLHSLADSGDATKVSSVCVRILRALGGDSRFEDNLFRQGRSSLNWRNRLALRAWQGASLDFRSLIKDYESHVASGDTPFPSPQYTPPNKASAVQDILFKLLKMFSTEGSSVIGTVNPSGFTSRNHDFSMSFHLASAAYVANANAVLLPLEAEYVKNGYETQLISDGKWEWAVFVSLCVMSDISDDQKRRCLQRAQSYVLRFFDASNEAARFFLETRVHIPPSWFTEALAYRFSNSNDCYSFVNRAISFDHAAALSLMEQKLLPELFFSAKWESDSALALIKHFANLAPGSLTMAMHRYFLLLKGFSDYIEGGTEESHKAFEENHTSVESCLLSYQPRSTSTASFLFPIGPTSKTGPAMVAAALKNLGMMRVQIEATASQRAGFLFESGDGRQFAVPK